MGVFPLSTQNNESRDKLLCLMCARRALSFLELKSKISLKAVSCVTFNADTIERSAREVRFSYHDLQVAVSC